LVIGDQKIAVLSPLLWQGALYRKNVMKRSLMANFAINLLGALAPLVVAAINTKTPISQLWRLSVSHFSGKTMLGARYRALDRLSRAGYFGFLDVGKINGRDSRNFCGNSGPLLKGRV
jgi:hypothetical protein